PTISDFSQTMTRSPSRVPTSAAVIPAAPAPITRRSVSLSQWRSADDGMRFRLKLAQVSKNDRYPGFKPHQQKFVEEGCSRHPVDRSDRILVDAEGRREQAHVHRDGGRSVEVNQQI